MIRLLSAIDSSPRLSKWSSRLATLPLVGPLWRRVWENPKEFERFVKFAIVGAIGAGVDFAVLNAMKRAFEAAGLGVGSDIPLSPHQIQLVAANAISFSAAVLSNFTWNRLWTFPESRDKPIGGQLVQFSIVNIIGLIINTVLLVFLDQFVFRHIFGERVSYNLAKACAIIVVLFWNFGINRIWTYRDIE